MLRSMTGVNSRLRRSGEEHPMDRCVFGGGDPMRSAIAFFLLACLAQAAHGVLITVDPSGFGNGTDIGNVFANITLSRAQGSLSTSGPTITVPLHLTSNLAGAIFASNGFFAHSGGEIWSAGDCCSGDTVLRVDFAQAASFVSVSYLPNDNDSPVFQAYDAVNNLLADLHVISNTPVSLSHTSSGVPIAYVLATYGDTGRIQSMSYELAPVPEPTTLALMALGLTGIGHSLRCRDTRSEKHRVTEHAG